MDITLMNNTSIITYHADGTVREEVVPQYQPSFETITIPLWYMSGGSRLVTAVTIPKPMPTDRHYYRPTLDIYCLTEQACSKNRGDIYGMWVSVPSKNIREQIECVALDILTENSDLSFEVIWRK